MISENHCNQKPTEHTAGVAERLVRGEPVVLERAKTALQLPAAVGAGVSGNATGQLYEAIYHSEELLRQLIESSRDCLKVLDLDGALLSMNGNGAKLLELDDPAARLHTFWADWWTDDGRELATAAVAAAREGRTTRFEALAPTANGTLKWWSVSVAPLCAPDGRPERLLVISRDVTARKTTEDDLRASDERFRVAFDQSIMGMALTDLDGVITRVNPAFCRITGRPPEEMLGRTSAHMTHADDRLGNMGEIQKIKDGRETSVSYSKRYLRPDSEIIWTQIHLSLMPDRANQPAGLVATVEDITEQKRSEQALREREQHLRLIFESVTDYAIFTLDPEGTVTSWNPGAVRTFGYRADEIVGQNAAQLWTPEDRAQDAPALERRTAAAQGSAEDERWHLRADGTRFFASGVVRSMHRADGSLRGFTKICRDVTAQREAERQLAAARAQIAATLETERARLAQVFNQSPSFMAVLRGPDHVFELANERYYQLVGHRDLIGKAVRTALPEVADQGFIELLDGVYRTGEAYIGSEVKVLVQREPNQPLEARHVDFVYQATREPDGSVSGIFVHGVDLTERKQAEAARQELSAELEQQSRVFNTALSAAKDYIFIFDRHGHFVFANQALLDLWGRSAQDAFGKHMRELDYPPEVEQSLQANVDRVFASGEPLTAETAYHSPTGTSGYYEYILAPVRNADGAVELVAGTSRDISERRRAEVEREQLLISERAARAEAERTSRMKDEFLATLSHELRTPLNAIVGWAQILRHDGRDGGHDPADLEQGLSTIERNARAQTQIIEDLLDMSAIISGKVRLNVQRLDLPPVVEAALETVRPAADARGVRLRAVLDPLAQPVSGDPNRLQQVFWNLLSNAVKFTPRGGHVQVVLERVNSHVEVSVIDTGIGIKSEFLPHVFDRFRQADSSTARQHGGLGLGLAIVKQLVELHGGTVRVKSGGQAQGTTFTVALPLTVLHGEASADAERRHPQSGETANLEFDACLRVSGVRVVVVDDEPDARAVVKRFLEDCEAIVLTAASATEALELVRTEKPDVLVSDIGMPGEDGYSLIRRVRALGPEQGGRVPAIALTAYARAEDRMKAVRAGFQMHVVKPVDAAELLTMVASLAGRTGGETGS